MGAGKPLTGDRFWVRVLLLLAAVPFFFVVIFLLPGYRHLLFSLFCIAAAVLGSREVARLFERRRMAGDWRLAGFCSALFPAGAYLENWDFVPAHTTGAAVTIAAAAALSVSVLASAGGGAGSGGAAGPAAAGRTPAARTLEYAGATLFACCYPGLLIGYLVRLAGVGEPRWMLLTFFAAVFGNDTIAYAAGKLARGRTALGLAVSPAKTAVGYVAGISASVGALLAARALFPGAPRFGTIEAAMGGAAIGVCAALGDLVESALKRAAQVKDSGHLIPGRGGLLDSIDSMLLCAPVFFLWMQTVEWPPPA